MAGVRVKVDLAGVNKKLSKDNMKRGKHLMMNQALVDMNENFVPMKDQNLRDSSHVSSDDSGIEWTAKHARKQYYSQFSNYTTPGTGPYWDKKAKGLFMSQWIEVFKRGAGF
ncbi:minor capsid protein [uncultured Enterococcus sp.]|uniref:minor capsid protein n=1 Tax=uncultured Enterococcus sp. TaxID=167972 RepID=UPI002AA937DD|nr:minor capsid protein [uncultured Enterococcus sp.]